MTRKGLEPAVTRSQQVGSLRLRLYLAYDDDDDVRAGLADLYRTHWPGLAPTLRQRMPHLLDAPSEIARLIGRREPSDVPVRAYLADVREFATRVGLDRITRVGLAPGRQFVSAGYLSSGTAMIHRFLWDLDKHDLGAAPDVERLRVAGRLVDRAAPLPTFLRSSSFGVAIPDVNGSIAATEETWDPRYETFSDARIRLRRQSRLPIEMIDSELERIVAEASYLLPDPSSVKDGIVRLDRAATWTFQRIRYRWTYRTIATKWALQHPNDLRVATTWDAEPQEWAEVGLRSPEPGSTPEVIDRVRRAIADFGTKTLVEVRTEPGRRPSREGQ